MWCYSLGPQGRGLPTGQATSQSMRERERVFCHQHIQGGVCDK